MANETIYRPVYTSSWALVIGINKYSKFTPLQYARSDAEAISNILTNRFDFPKANVHLLLDEDASRENIMCSYLEYSNDIVTADDRILFFFAGHGMTKPGRRGEIGYLIPADGDSANLATLIRWDDITRNAEVIPAKHMVFLMDACYGGLAVTRSIPAGSSRFLNDMLMRYSRQVLTAGKSDEVVADSGGPIPNHSIFTGHLLQALEGAVITSDGVISANAVMAYVYENVSKDPYSSQSPHYGFFDGDGDFIFKTPDSWKQNVDEEIGLDLLIQSSPFTETSISNETQMSFGNHIKELLSDSRFRIKLEDTVDSELRIFLAGINSKTFDVEDTEISRDKLIDRMRRYEQLTDKLQQTTILLSRWGADNHLDTLGKIIAHTGNSNKLQSGQIVWLGLRWYPLLLLSYSGGISALAANNYSALSTLFKTTLCPRIAVDGTRESLIALVSGISDVGKTKIFKQLPGHEKHFVPLSEYLYKVIQHSIEDLLFLGDTYEELFDRYEILQALVYLDLAHPDLSSNWAPPGRFAWKHQRLPHGSPFNMLVDEAINLGDEWLPLKAGLFRSSRQRFLQVASTYREFIEKLPWF